VSRNIDIQRIDPHPHNANVMSADAMKKLARHIQRTRRYEALVVRPRGGTDDEPRYQVLNGHHRLEVLRRLGHQRVRCEVWDVDDREALLLLATLNRLEGRDDPSRRAALLARLAGQDNSAADLAKLARLLPENRAALERAIALAREPLPVPVAPGDAPRVFAPMTFFLTDDENRTVGHALRVAAREVAAGSATGKGSKADAPTEALGGANDNALQEPRRGRRRAAALVTLAERFIAGAPAGRSRAIGEEDNDHGMRLS